MKVQLVPTIISVDRRTGDLSRDGVFCPKLTRAELNVLLALATLRTGSRQRLLDEAYRGRAVVPDAKILDVFICKIRSKLGQRAGVAPLIVTISARYSSAGGFMLADHVAVEVAPTRRETRLTEHGTLYLLRLLKLCADLPVTALLAEQVRTEMVVEGTAAPSSELSP